MTKKLTKEQFIEKARQIHGDKYGDYAKVEYVNSRTKVCIVCPKHGEFYMGANSHLRGRGCPKCANEERSKKYTLPQDEIIRRFKKIHGDKYDYSKVKYINLQTKVCIICPIHGEFWQTPTGHYFMKEGCPKCSGSGNFYNNEYFISKAHEIHGDKYDYSKVNIDTTHDMVTIICPKHGEFRQRAYSHIEGYGCRKCADEKRKEMFLLSQDEIIQRFKEAHGNKYDYSKVEYKGLNTKVCIICPIHGEFWQTPFAHSSVKHGCPQCQKSKMEEQIGLIFYKNKIVYNEQWTFEWLKNDANGYNLHLDFYLPEYNIAVECQGGQHFIPVDFFGGQEVFEQTIKRDAIKYQKCKEHNIKILYIVPKLYLKEDFFNKNYSNKNILIQENCRKELIDYINKLK